ncbi:MAG: hypothetical protein COZ23_05760 [Hydrogenophilales bacterium CG_4_10_14_3_um_filter_58_23]|nr:MAG: hypothetical protein COW70_04900 [Hydrogenophilales bacterium CG18_big_fil_WC_8_21_14_2_50_58_12]PIY00935.1 MAG: hypothetical protein COZ23_05760 [Hydrogenophilales bacterium CG_4_10_14_3_um_filter_58_23]
MTSQDIFNWLFVLSPLIVGSTIFFLKYELAVAKIDRLDAWLIEKYEATRVKDGAFNVYVIQPLLWMLTRVMTKTESMPDAFLRSGIRVTAYAYITALVIYMLIFAVALVLTVVFLMVLFWLIAEFSEQNGAQSSSSEIVTSRERESLFGDKYTEHLNGQGEVIGESRERESLFGGKYTEHQNGRGEVIGESHERESFFGGKYTEHQNDQGEVVGESRKQEGLFGDQYTETKSK